MRILVIEDEENIALAVQGRLMDAGYIVDVQHDGLDGYFDARTGVYDLIILDIMLPSMNGLEILEKLRQEKITSKIIMLTALATVKDRIVGLERGANDYLPKPFHMDELLARVKAQLRMETDAQDKIAAFGLELDLKTAALTFEKKEVGLSAKELQLMELLLNSPGRIFEYGYIYQKIWGMDYNMDSNCLETYISFLRKKLRLIGADVRITSVRHMGYKLEQKKYEKD